MALMTRIGLGPARCEHGDGVIPARARDGRCGRCCQLEWRQREQAAKEMEARGEGPPVPDVLPELAAADAARLAGLVLAGVLALPARTRAGLVRDMIASGGAFLSVELVAGDMLVTLAGRQLVRCDLRRLS